MGDYIHYWSQDFLLKNLKIKLHGQGQQKKELGKSFFNEFSVYNNGNETLNFKIRKAPFFGKEKINKFYGMDEDELYLIYFFLFYFVFFHYKKSIIQNKKYLNF